MKKAFSLIELSIVILIIGILVAGIMQASRLVRISKLSSARTLTQSSPVGGIKDLVGWWESTSEKSITDAEATDGAQVSVWYDINPISKQNNILQAVSANQPLYKTDIINNLPALKFDGSTDYFEVSYDQNLNPGAVTIFAVARVLSVPTYGAIVSSRNDGPSLGYMIYAAPTAPVGYEMWAGDGVSSWGVGVPKSTIVLDKATILSATNDGAIMKLYDKGSLLGSVSAAMARNNARPFRIGAGRNENATPDFYFNGYIAEVIIFGRMLATEERKEVEKYLGKKWNIGVS